MSKYSNATTYPNDMLQTLANGGDAEAKKELEVRNANSGKGEELYSKLFDLVKTGKKPKVINPNDVLEITKNVLSSRQNGLSGRVDDLLSVIGVNVSFAVKASLDVEPKPKNDWSTGVRGEIIGVTPTKRVSFEHGGQKYERGINTANWATLNPDGTYTPITDKTPLPPNFEQLLIATEDLSAVILDLKGANKTSINYLCFVLPAQAA